VRRSPDFDLPGDDGSYQPRRQPPARRPVPDAPDEAEADVPAEELPSWAHYKRAPARPPKVIGSLWA
jgi:hypothetical protein